VSITSTTIGRTTARQICWLWLDLSTPLTTLKRITAIGAGTTKGGTA